MRNARKNARSDPLISSFTVETKLSVHSTEQLELEAVAHLDADLTAALPYLNAELDGARYSPSVPALIWLVDGRHVGIMSDRIALDHLHEDEQARVVFKEIVSIINQIWARRAELTPRTAPRNFRRPLEIYALLPRTNCRDCGESTCYSFALKLTAGVIESSDCNPLYDRPQNIDRRIALENLLKDKEPTK